MKKLALTLGLGVTMFSFAAFAESWTGVIGDSKCGAKHADAMDNEGSAKCVKTCVEGGAAPVLLTDGKVVKLDKASQTKVMDHLGHKVTVTGKMAGGALHIDSVSM